MSGGTLGRSSRVVQRFTEDFRSGLQDRGDLAARRTPGVDVDVRHARARSELKVGRTLQVAIAVRPPPGNAFPSILRLQVEPHQRDPRSARQARLPVAPGIRLLRVPRERCGDNGAGGPITNEAVRDRSAKELVSLAPDRPEHVRKRYSRPRRRLARDQLAGNLIKVDAGPAQPMSENPGEGRLSDPRGAGNDDQAMSLIVSGFGASQRRRTWASRTALTVGAPMSCMVVRTSLVRISTTRRTPSWPPAISPYR